MMRRMLAATGVALLMSGLGAGADDALPACAEPACARLVPDGTALGGATADAVAASDGWPGGSGGEAAPSGVTPLADGAWDALGPADTDALDAPPALDRAGRPDPCPFIAADPVRLARLAAIAGEDALRAEAAFRLPQARRCGG